VVEEVVAALALSALQVVVALVRLQAEIFKVR